MKTFSFKVVWGTLLVIVTFLAALTGILGWAGVSPKEAKQSIELAVNLSAELDADELAALGDFVTELRDRGLLEKWAESLDKDLAAP